MNSNKKVNKGVHNFWETELNPITMQRDFVGFAGNSIICMNTELHANINGKNALLDESINLDFEEQQAIQFRVQQALGY